MRSAVVPSVSLPSPPLFSPARCLRADAGEYGPPRRGTRGTEISSSRIADLALSLTLCFLPARPHFSSPRASSNASSFCVSKLQPASRVLRRPAVLDRPLASSPTTLSAPPSAGFRPRMQNYWAGGASSTAPGSPCAFCARQLTVSGTFQSTGTACVASRSSRSRTVRPLPARLRASSADSADRPYPTPRQHALLSPPRGLARRACTRARGIRSEPSLDCPSPDRAAVLAADPCAVRPLRRAFARRALKVDSRRGESAGEVEGKVCVAVMPPQSTSIYVLAETGGVLFACRASLLQRRPRHAESMLTNFPPSRGTRSPLGRFHRVISLAAALAPRRTRALAPLLFPVPPSALLKPLASMRHLTLARRPPARSPPTSPHHRSTSSVTPSSGLPLAAASGSV